MAYVKWQHRKTGTIYKKVEFIEHANLAKVTTEAGSTYVVDSRQIKAVRS